MALATAIASPEPEAPSRRRFWPQGSRLGRLIIALNFLGLAILIIGALTLNEMRRGLVNARVESLITQGEWVARLIDEAATVGEPEPALQPERAARLLQLLHLPRSQRVRLFDKHGELIADSYFVADRVDWKPLPPARKPGQKASAASPSKIDQRAARALKAELDAALRGEPVKGRRVGEGGVQVVSVSLPIQRVRAVLGVLTLEAGDVDEIIAAERAALLPFILIAIGVTLLSSILIYALVARPVLRLARAADRVQQARARSISMPDLARRQDEIGDLTRSLELMTDSLSERMDAIERFAADVAHEIRNPLTSIRSAVETLDLVGDGAARERLMGILKQDVGRLDRLVTDIANASRLDAELSRDEPRRLDLARLINDIVDVYTASARPGVVSVRVTGPAPGETLMVAGREGPLGQVFRNLIDNARSFSAPGGEVRVEMSKARGQATVVVEDDGPGIPHDNLETVFERFYTSRPKGTAFGGNSGLGLSIARQIVAAHGGEIHAENRLDAAGEVLGARFIVHLPERVG
ncbi:MAG: stimulus-sensing domain-containing protein [Caulobacter sp.]|nr:stimulus-sensing domain-containing protein [Caulobacter sp.]